MGKDITLEQYLLNIDKMYKDCGDKIYLGNDDSIDKDIYVESVKKYIIENWDDLSGNLNKIISKK